jgi:hypothetical protein
MHTRRFRQARPAFALGSLLSLALAILAVLPGCGGVGISTATAYPVKGKVLLADGSPLKEGKIIFLPKEANGMPAKGDIGPDGTFSLKTADDREGAPAGVYKVRIEPAASSASVKGGKLETAKLPFPAIYTDEDGETGLTATVKAESTQLEPFKLVVVSSASSKDRVRD